MGATALSAALLNRRTGWVRSYGEVQWRSPLSANNHHLGLEAERSPTNPDLAQSAPGLAGISHPIQTLTIPVTDFAQAQTWLGLALPFQCSRTQTWLPALQWSDTQALALHDIQHLLTSLLASLQSPLPAADPQITNGLPTLAGVVVNHSADSTEAYDFNLREVMLAAGFVSQPEQVYFVEGAIAALLAAIAPMRDAVATSLAYRGTAANLQTGMTLVVLVEAASTELLLVDLPATPDLLARSDCQLRGLPYGVNALDQDVICQLLYPRLRQTNQLLLTNRAVPGEPDQQVRIQLLQQLNSHPLGQDLVTIAADLRTSLCRAAIAAASFKEYEWSLDPADFSKQILLPFLQSLNRELNTLLSQTGTVAAAIRQVICVGEVAQAPAVGHWLKQKLPTATLVAAQAPSSPGSLVAQGLAQIPLYPQLVNANRHQYSNLFLLRELLIVMPDQPLGLGKILQQLERRGINTAACQRSLLQILEGYRPDALLPNPTDWALLTINSQQHPNYQALRTQPLFTKHNHQYQFNPALKDCLQRHITSLLATTRQSVQDPLSFELQANERSLV